MCATVWGQCLEYLLCITLKKGSEDENLEDYVPYVRVKDRRKQKLVKLGRITEIKEDTKPSGAGGSG